MYNSDLLEKYVSLYNYGAEQGDFEPMLELFTQDAVYEFEDPRIGSFVGKDSISRMFNLQQPDSSLSLIKVRETNTAAIADYGDDISPMTRLGSIQLQAKDGKITKIIIKR